MRVLNPTGLGFFACVDGPLDGDQLCFPPVDPPSVVRCQVVPGPGQVGPELINVVYAFTSRDRLEDGSKPVHVYVRCPNGCYHHHAIEGGA